MRNLALGGLCLAVTIALGWPWWAAVAVFAVNVLGWPWLARAHSHRA